MPLRRWEEEKVDLEVASRADQGVLEAVETANRVFRPAAEDLELRDRATVAETVRRDRTVEVVVAARQPQAQ